MQYPSIGRQLHLAARGKSDVRLTVLAVFFAFGIFIIISKLFFVMIIQHNFYTALAAGEQEIYAKLFPKRGTISLQDSRTREAYPVAMNRDYFIVFADTRAIKDDQTAELAANKLSELFHYPDDKKLTLYQQLNKRTDAYRMIEQKVDESVVASIKSLALPGIQFVRKSYRYYPEANLAAGVVGFVGKDTNGQEIGRYGIEGYWQETLAGTGGFFFGSKTATGHWLPLAGEILQPAEDGANLLLTIDRTLQYVACEKLRAKLSEYGATSASLIVMEPQTGAILVMCSLPDFNPNTYNRVSSPGDFNNSNIFTPYEPGSVFKPITMAAALATGAVTPETTYLDTGARPGVCKTPIKNAGDKAYGLQPLVGILENSINTGMVYVVEKLGKKNFLDYVQAFGFGVKEGIPLDTEVGGNIDSLKKNPDRNFDCFSATGAFGQGLTVTPLQMITAFSAIVNGGLLMKPYLVDEITYPDGHVARTKPTVIRRVIDARSAALTRAMLIAVVDKGQARHARVPGYYVAGKTGTAQIPGLGGYTEETNHTFVGFAPADNPKFVMLIKFEKPARKYADSTAAPLFAELTQFFLQYYHVPTTR